MITGEIKNKVDQIWDNFWTGGITNSITILEQRTYLFFMKMLDDAELVEAVMNQFDDVWMGKMCKKCKRREFCGDPIE